MLVCLYLVFVVHLTIDKQCWSLLISTFIVLNSLHPPHTRSYVITVKYLSFHICLKVHPCPTLPPSFTRTHKDFSPLPGICLHFLWKLMAQKQEDAWQGLSSFNTPTLVFSRLISFLFSLPLSFCQDAHSSATERIQYTSKTNIQIRIEYVCGHCKKGGLYKFVSANINVRVNVFTFFDSPNSCCTNK